MKKTSTTTIALKGKEDNIIIIFYSSTFCIHTLYCSDNADIARDTIPKVQENQK
jgi:hypothetical protein